MVVRVCIDADHSPFVTSLAFPQGIAPGENIELYIGTWDLPTNPPPKANTIVVDPLTKVVHVARTLESGSKRPSDSPLEPNRKRAFVIPNSGATTSNGTGKHKCGECGQFFSSIKEISVHMQQHLSSRIPQEKVSVVTLTHRPKDGSPPTKATITQDPSRPNIVEISIPATAVESFMNAVNDQAQQLLLKFAKPQAGNRLEIKKTEHQSEGDAFKKITMEALYEHGLEVFRERTIIPTKLAKMTPEQLLKFEFLYTKSLYERGLLERSADSKRFQQEKEQICPEERTLEITHPSDTDNESQTKDPDTNSEEGISEPDEAINSESSSSTSGPQQCPECSRRILDAKLFKQHVSECRLMNPKKCPDCSLPFPTISQRNRHQREAHGAKTQWRCSHCVGPPEYFISEKSLDLHVYKIHGKSLTAANRETIRNKYQCVCSQCGYKTWSKKTLQVHRTKEHISREWTSWCPACAFGADNAAQLVDHVKTMHTDDPCWFVCLICNRAISRVGGDQSAELHQALHAEGAGFPCPQCCKMFETEEKLTVHLGIHAVDISSYHCGVCDTPNRTYRGLARHMALNHRPTKSALESASTSRPGLHKSTSGTYVCNQCAQTYDCESQLVAHQVCLHQGFEGEQYPCPYCLKIFARQHYLALHLRRHLDEKPHKCSFCSRSFSHFSSLKGHVIMKHTRDFRFNCPQCDKGFVSRMKVLKHLTQTHHVSMEQATEAVPREGRVANTQESSAADEGPVELQEAVVEDGPRERDYAAHTSGSDNEVGVEDLAAPFVTGGSVFYQLTHPDGSQSVVRLEPGQQLLLEDEQGVKQVIDFNDILPKLDDSTAS